MATPSDAAVKPGFGGRRWTARSGKNSSSRFSSAVDHLRLRSARRRGLLGGVALAGPGDLAVFSASQSLWPGSLLQARRAELRVRRRARPWSPSGSCRLRSTVSGFAGVPWSSGVAVAVAVDAVPVQRAVRAALGAIVALAVGPRRLELRRARRCPGVSSSCVLVERVELLVREVELEARRSRQRHAAAERVVHDAQVVRLAVDEVVGRRRRGRARASGRARG